jgi:glucose/arabinose dehydrogenase
LDHPWALKVLPDGRILVTQRTAPGALSIVTPAGAVTAVTGLPGNVGMLDIELAPDFAASNVIYFSFMVRDLSALRIGRYESDPCCVPERMVVARARLVEGGSSASLSDLQEIFRQQPTITTYPDSGEPGGRITFSPDGRYVFITSGDRQEYDTRLLQTLANNIGCIVRIFPDGSIPPDNPFVSNAGARSEIWTWGHRNPYGLVFAPDGKLWSSEMGPMGGDELNLILPGRNYGWPVVSNGDFYDGTPIPDHSPGDGFEAPKESWTPVIAPAGMLFYKGDEFADWRGDIIITGLASKSLVRVRLNGTTASEVQRFDMGARTRDIAEGADGSLWIITDGSVGQLRRITPQF